MPVASVTTTASAAVPGRQGRNGLVLQNLSDTDLYVAPASDVSAANGYKLTANGGSLNLTGGGGLVGAFYAIHGGAGSKDLRWFDF
jgi:hypothetical protein